MRTVATIAELRKVLTRSPNPIGLVPTMGFLHEGHLSLIRCCRSECRTAVVSIFVNPTQFGPNEDLGAYPRDLPADLRKCEAEGVDLVFCPSPHEMYPEGHAAFVEVEGVSARWEGASRPTHFRGVATIVTKLFRTVRPARAYFGEKDYQQLQVVRRLTADLSLDVDVVACPTVREPDGLALSSRNVHLVGRDRERARALFAALQAACEAVAKGQTSGQRLCSVMTQTVARFDGVELDYAAVVDAETLEPAQFVGGRARALIAARVGGVRLIDNVALEGSPPGGRAGHH